MENIHYADTQNIKPVQDIYYNSEMKTKISVAYIFALVLWVSLIYGLKLYIKVDIIAILILAIPFVSIGISYVNLSDCTADSSQNMLKNNVVALILLVSTVIINWDSKPLVQRDKTKFFRIIVTGVMLLMLTMIDIWGSTNFGIVASHIRTGIQSIVIALFSYAIYTYYIECTSC